MLKINTALTALGIVLMSVCGFLLTTALIKLDATHDATLQVNVKIDNMAHTLDDHENRIRLTEEKVIGIQHERQVWNSPNAKEQNP